MASRSALLLLMASCLFLGSCSKTPEDSKDLVGNWQWIRTDNYINHKTPANTGQQIEMQLHSDGRYTIYTNGVVSSSGTYQLERRECIHDRTNKILIKFSKDQEQMVELLSQKLLYFSDEYADGFKSEWLRK